MAIAAEMKELVQGIVFAHEDRAQGIKKIEEETKQVRKEAWNLIGQFQASRKELRAELEEASAVWQGLWSTKAKK